MDDLIQKLTKIAPDGYLDIQYRKWRDEGFEWTITSINNGIWEFGDGSTIEESIRDLYNKIKP